MKKEKVLGFFKELVCWFIVIVILQLIANKLGWTDISVRDNVIGLTIGWIIWKIIMAFVNRKNK